MKIVLRSIFFVILFSSLLFISNVYSEYIKLKNGVNVIFDSDKNSSLSAIQVWVRAGAVDESKEESGISHFIEHTIFKGTKTRTQKEIAPEIEKIGGIINAATSLDYTYFYTIVSSSYCLKAVEILTDAILNPEFPAEEIEKERHVVVEEIKRKDDNPQSQLFNEFYEQVYSPLKYAQRVIGTEEIILNLKRGDLLAFHKKFYTSENIFIVVTGNYEKNEVLAVLSNNFGKLPKIKSQKRIFSSKDLNVSKKLSKKIIKRDVSQAYILLGFPAANINSKDQFSLDIASYILGNGKASRLNKKFVEESRLAFNITSSFVTQEGPGLFYVYSQCLPGNVSTLSNRILLELLDISMNGVSDEELNRAKILLIRDKLLQLQTPDGKAEELGFYAVLGNKNIPESYVKNVRKVTTSNIKKVISKYLIFPDIPTIVITP
ncbi:MAG: pitrilysin family protein [Elusimicrobia bacterium]|nr:pitrilysin family protein [Elusimicrobiota bacterium]